MNSHNTDKFRKAFAELPADVRKQARQAYRLFIENPQSQFAFQIHSPNATDIFSAYWFELSRRWHSRRG